MITVVDLSAEARGARALLWLSRCLALAGFPVLVVDLSADGSLTREAGLRPRATGVLRGVLEGRVDSRQLGTLIRTADVGVDVVVHEQGGVSLSGSELTKLSEFLASLQTHYALTLAHIAGRLPDPGFFGASPEDPTIVIHAIDTPEELRLLLEPQLQVPSQASDRSEPRTLLILKLSNLDAATTPESLDDELRVPGWTAIRYHLRWPRNDPSQDASPAATEALNFGDPGSWILATLAKEVVRRDRS